MIPGSRTWPPRLTCRAWFSGGRFVARWRPQSEKMRLLAQLNLTADQIEDELRAISGSL